MSEDKGGCGCGERAEKLVRKLGVDEEQMPTDYIYEHHAKATAKALWLKLSGRVE